MQETPVTDQKSAPEEQPKKLTRRDSLGIIALTSTAALSAVSGRLYAKAAVKRSFDFNPEPGSPVGG